MLGEGYSNYYVSLSRNYFPNKSNRARVVYKNQENGNLLPGWFLQER